MANLWLNSTGNDRFNWCLLKEHIKTFYIESKFSCENMGMIIYPKLPTHILQDWITRTIDNRTIFSQKKVFAVKDEIIYIVHERSSTIIRINLPRHLHPFCTRKRNTL